MLGLGETAGLITALSWAGSCQVHTMAGRMIGTINLLVARLPLFLAATGMVVLLSGTSTAAAPGAIVFAMLSGVMSFGFSDPFFYSACLTIGPRLGTLLLSLSACITALLGHVLLEESINLTGWLGILVAMSGVAFVLIEGGIHHGAELSGLSNMRILIGVGKGLMGAVMLAVSFLLLKQGIILGVEPFWATFLRLFAGGIFIWLIALARGEFVRAMRSAWTSWPVMRLLVVGCLVSLVGNCLSPVAVKYTHAGIAATLFGLQPVMIIIIIALYERKRPSGQALIGTCAAFAGTALIFLR